VFLNQEDSKPRCLVTTVPGQIKKTIEIVDSRVEGAMGQRDHALQTKRLQRSDMFDVELLVVRRSVRKCLRACRLFSSSLRVTKVGRSQDLGLHAATLPR